MNDSSGDKQNTKLLAMRDYSACTGTSPQKAKKAVDPIELELEDGQKE